MSHLRILLIESDSTMLDTLQALLSLLGHEVSMVPDGLIGLAELERRLQLPDLILLRVEIPRMSGYTVCNKIKRREKLRNIPLILFSSQATSETFAQHRRLRTRADGYLTIPFEDDFLLNLIGELTQEQVRSGSFVEVPAVPPESFSSIPMSSSLPSQGSAASMGADFHGRGPSHVGTMTDMQGVSMSSPPNHPYEEIHSILDGDPMVLDVEDVRNGGSFGGDPLGADSLDALIIEEQEKSAQHLRSLWSASLESPGGDHDDFDRTIVGQKTPHKESKVSSEPRPFSAPKPSDSGSSQHWSSYESESDETQPHNATQIVRNFSGDSLDEANTELLGDGKSRQPTPAPDSGNDYEHAESSEFLLDEEINMGLENSQVDLHRWDSQDKLEEAKSEPFVNDTGADQGDIVEMLNAHFQEIIDEDISPDHAALLQQKVQDLEEEVEKLQANIKVQETDFEMEREQWRKDSDGASGGNAEVAMQLAEAQAQLDAYLDEKEDLYKEITDLRKTIGRQKSTLESTSEAASLVSTTNDELDELRRQLNETSRSLRKIEEARDQLSEEVDQYKQVSETESLQRESFELQVKQLQREYEALQRLYNVRDAEIEQFDVVIEELHGQIKERDTGARELRSELAALRAHMEGQLLSDDELLLQSVDKEKELQFLREDINQLGESYDQLEKRYQVTLAEREKFHEELESRNKALLSLSAGQDQLRASQDRTHEDLGKKEEQLQISKVRVEELESEIDALNGDLSITAEERNKYRDEVLNLNNEVDAARGELRNLQDSEQLLRGRMQEAEDQREQFEYELEQAQSKLRRLEGGQEELELEVVQLRKQNMVLEQEQFEWSEKKQRFSHQVDELENKLSAERDGRLNLLSQNDGLDSQLNKLRVVLESTENERDSLQNERDSLQSERDDFQKKLQEENHRRAELEDSQALSLHSLETVQQDFSTQLEHHQHELLSLQEDFEAEAIAQKQQLLDEANRRETMLRDEWHRRTDSEKIELKSSLDKQRKDEISALEERHQNELSLLKRQHQEDAELLKHQKQDELARLEHLREDENRGITAEHQTQLAQMLREHASELEANRLAHDKTIEQVQKELQQQHEQLFGQLEDDNRRLRQKMREQEDEHRQSVLRQTEDWRRETEHRVDEAHQQFSLRNQALVEGYEQRESEMDRQLKEYRLKIESRENWEREREDREREREDELTRLRGRLADLESLRQHERTQLQRTEQENAERTQTLESKITQLEKALQKGISESSHLYQKMKRHEMRKEHTVKALQDALALLGEGEEPSHLPPRTPTPAPTPAPSMSSSSLPSSVPSSLPSESYGRSEEKEKPRFSDLESFARKLDF